MSKKNVLLLTIILISVVTWIMFFNDLPAKLPVHWNQYGKIDGYAPKLVVFIVTHVILIFMYLLYKILPKIDPYRDNYNLFSKSYFSIFLAIMLTFFLFSILTLYAGLGRLVNMGKVAPLIIGCLFVAIGLFIPKVRRNFFVGMRFPWTLKNETVWDKTHRLSGRVFLISGLTLVIAALLPGVLIWYVLTAIVLLIVFLPFIYSYIIYSKLTK